ncbi:glycosyltransferase [bacterium]|nr:glycosyltransferase [bacterium]
MKTEITVLMAVYNGEKYVREAIESILSQTFKDFEFLIVDDGSDDSTPRILAEYKDSRIKIVRNPKNIGLAASLNTGIKLSSGKFIARQDADDISMPERLERQVSFIHNKKDIALVGTWVLTINSNGEKVDKVIYPCDDATIRKNIVVRNQFAHGSVMYRKGAVVSAGCYNELFRFSEDYNLWLRLVEFGEAANIPEFLYKWRMAEPIFYSEKKIGEEMYCLLTRELFDERKKGNKANLQFLTPHWVEENLSLIKQQFGFKRRRTVSQFFCNWALKRFLKGDKVNARRYIRMALRNNPFSVQVYKNLLIIWIFGPLVTLQRKDSARE